MQPAIRQNYSPVHNNSFSFITKEILMKILTLNTHSYLEDDFPKKLGSIILAILKEKFDIIVYKKRFSVNITPYIGKHTA